MSSPTVDVPDASRDRRRARGAWVAVADAIALLTFVAVGLRSHRIGAVAGIAARNAIPLAIAWFVVAALVGTYRRGDLRSLVVTWAVAVPVALLARTWWVGSPSGARIGVFVAVGLTFTLCSLAAGRIVVALGTRSRPVWRER